MRGAHWVFAALLLSLLLQLGSSQNVDVNENAPQEASAFSNNILAVAGYNYGGLSVNLNETSGEYYVETTDDVGVLTVSGRNGDSAEFVIADSTALDPNKTNLQFRVIFSDVQIVLDLADIAYVPDDGGQSVQTAFALASFSQSDLINNLFSLLESQSVTPAGATSGGSRKRSFSTLEGLEHVAKRVREVANKRREMHRSVEITGPIGERLEYIRAIEELSGKMESSADVDHEINGRSRRNSQNGREDFMHAMDRGNKAIKQEILRLRQKIPDDEEVPPDEEYVYFRNGRWVRASKLTSNERYAARITPGMTMHLSKLKYVSESFKTAKSIRELQNRKRTIIGTLTVANSAETQALLEQVGGACNTLKYGGGFVRGLQDACTLQALTHLNQGYNQDLAQVQDAIKALLEAQEQTSVVLEGMQEVDASLQRQTESLQKQLDIVNGELFNSLGKFDALSKNAHEAALVDQVLQSQNSQNTASIARLTVALNQNAEATAAALKGSAEYTNENTAIMQSQMAYMDRQLKAALDREIQQVYVNMATMQQKLVQAINMVATDTSIRLGEVVDQLNTALDEVYVYLGKNTDFIHRIDNFVNSLYQGMTAIFNHEFQDGDLNWQYWVMKDLIKTFDNGTYTPFVFDNTGKRPVNMTNYSVREGRSIEFSTTSIETCQLTNPEVVIVENYVQDVLKDTAEITTLLPIGLHPNYLAYSCAIDDVPTLLPANARLYHGIFYMSTTPQTGALSPYLFKYDGVTLTFLPDTPANRLDPNVFHWFAASQDFHENYDSAVRNGQNAYLYGFSGAIAYMVSYTQVADIDDIPTFEFDPVQITPMAYTPEPSTMRTIGRTLDQQQREYMAETPFSQTTNAFTFPGDLNVFSEPSVLPVINLGDTGFWLHHINYISYQPPSNTSGLVDELLNSATTNITLITEYNSPFAGPTVTPLNRKRRDVTDYAITISNNRAVAYDQLTAEEQEAAATCTASGGMYMSIMEPKLVVMYQNDDFTGNQVQVVPSANMYNFGNLNAKSVIVPPSLTVKVYQDPSTASNDHCTEYKFTCKWYVQVAVCYYLSELEQAILNQRSTICEKKFMMQTAEGHIGTTEPDSQFYLSLIRSKQNRAASGSVPADGCNGMKEDESYTPYCIFKDTPDNWEGDGEYAGLSDHYRSSTKDSQTTKEICYSTRLGVQMSSFWNGLKLQGNLQPKNRLPFPSPKATDVDVVTNSFTCTKCQTNYGVLDPGSGEFLAVNGACPPGLGLSPNATIGDNSSYTYQTANTAGIQVNIQPVTTSIRFWRSCQPADKAAYNLEQNSAKKWEKYSLPYFFTPGDLDGQEYSPNQVTTFFVVPPCEDVAVGLCTGESTGVTSGSLYGFCEKQIDPYSTIPSPILTNVVVKCGYVSKSPCYNLTTVESCISEAVTGAYLNATVPICMWETVNNRCISIDDLKINTIEVQPSPDTGSVANYILPCQYRDSFVRTSCTFDNRCYKYSPIYTNTQQTECLPLKPGGAAILENFTAFDLPTDYAGAADFLINDLGVNPDACGALQSGCVLKSDQAHVRLQYLLTLYMNITTPDHCSQLGYSERGPCQWKYMFRPANWTFSYGLSYLEADGLVPFCEPIYPHCRPKCEIYGLDLSTCIPFGDFNCFVSAFNMTCLQATQEKRNAICAGQPSAVYDIGSPCIQSGNICGALLANQTLDGTPLVYNETLNNTALLETSECAMIAGFNWGNLSNAALAPRLAGVTLPSYMASSCTAVVTAEGTQCMPTDLVAGCGAEAQPVCDMLTDLQRNMEDLIKRTYCTFTTLGECLMSTSDNMNYPCAWIDGQPGVCTWIASAQNMLAQNPRITVWTKATYSKAHKVVSAKSVGTYNSYVKAGLDPTTFKYLPSDIVNYYKDVLVLEYPKPICNLPGLPIPVGFVCCSDPSCTVWERNPLHPKMLHIQKTIELCHDQSLSVVDTSTVIEYACVQRSGTTAFLNTTTNYTGYVCEPFVSEAGAALFPFYEPAQRAPTPVIFNPGQTRTMIPVRWYPPLGAPGGEYRLTISPYNVSFMNAVYMFDGNYALTSQSVGNPLDFLVDANATDIPYGSPLQNNGIYLLATTIVSSLQRYMDYDIANYVDLNQRQFGPNPQTWYVFPDYGVYKETISSTVTPLGREADKMTTLTMAYGKKVFDVPIWSVVNYIVTASVTLVNTNGVVQSASRVVIDNSAYASLVPTPGTLFINHKVGNTLYSVGPQFIGLNECNKVAYVNTARPTADYNFTTAYSGGPATIYDARCATSWPSNFKVEVPPGAEPGTPSEQCGDIIGSTVFGDAFQQDETALKVQLNYPILTEEGQVWWDNVTQAYGPSLVAQGISVLQELWTELGCTNPLQNFRDPGQLIDAFRVWLVAGFLPLTQTLDRPLIKSLMQPYFSAQNRLMCGNCIFIKNPDGDGYLTEMPGVPNVCNADYGTEPAPAVLTSGDFDSQRMSRLWWCNSASIARFIMDPVLRKATIIPNPGLVPIQASFPNLVIDTLRQYTPSNLCSVGVNGSNTVLPGSYELSLANPYKQISLQGILRLRQNESDLNTPLGEGLQDCQADIAFTIPPGPAERSFIYPICQGSNFFQAFTLTGIPCGIVYNANLTYTPTQLNTTQNMIFQEILYESAIQNATRAMDNSYKKLLQEQEVNFNRTTVQLSNSIVNLTDSVIDLNKEAQQSSERINNLNSSVVNIADQTEIIGVGLVQVNNSLNDLGNKTQQLEVITENQNTRLEDLDVAQNQTFEAINQLNNESAANKEEIEQNKEQIANNTKELDKLNELIEDVADIVGNFTGGGSINLEQELQNQNTFSIIETVLASLAVVLVVALGIGFTVYVVKRNKAEKALKAAGGMMQGQAGGAPPEAHGGMPQQPPSGYGGQPGYQQPGYGGQQPYQNPMPQQPYQNQMPQGGYNPMNNMPQGGYNPMGNMPQGMPTDAGLRPLPSMSSQASGTTTTWNGNTYSNNTSTGGNIVNTGGNNYSSNIGSSSGNITNTGGNNYSSNTSTGGNIFSSSTGGNVTRSGGNVINTGGNNYSSSTNTTNITGPGKTD